MYKKRHDTFENIFHKVAEAGSTGEFVELFYSISGELIYILTLYESMQYLTYQSDYEEEQ